VHIDFNKSRQFLVFLVFLCLFAILFARLIYIQIIRKDYLSRIADKQHKIFVKLEPKRGSIYDRLNRVLAIYLETVSIYANPREIKDKKKLAKTLADRLNINEGTLLGRFKKDNYFCWVKRKTSSKEADKVSKLNLKGVYLTKEPKRFYPGEKLACHILGLTGIDNNGLEGVELYYDKALTGEYGWRRSLRDAKRREITSLESDALPARDGNSLVLAIDQVIQHIIEKETESIVKKYKPKAVSIVVVNPKTGGVLGLVSYPWFDPNNIASVEKAYLKNKAISDSFEPGSVFKIITASAALNEKIVDFDSEFFCENGAYRVGKRILHDYRPYGMLTFREVIEKSSNIGTVKVAKKLGKEKLYEYIKRFNFGEIAGIDLPGEAYGIVRNPDEWSYVDMTTIPMGQGIAVTSLQLALALSVIANDGVLMRPYVVKKLLNEEGVAIKENKPKIIRRVISKRAADEVKELLGGVVERGTGKRARMDHFRAGGKTGTAQKVNPRGGYYKDKYIASFIGFAPYENPLVAISISVDEPRGKHFGGQVAAPAFKNITEKILSYMEVESDRNEVKETL